MPLARPAHLSPEFVNRQEGKRPRLRHVLEAASQRIVAANGSPVDTKRRVNRRLDVLRVNVAILRPAVIDRVGSPCVRLPNYRAALDAAAREESELLRPVVPAGLRRDRPDGASEFAV